MFANFQPSLLDAMAREDLAFHYHTYGITMTNYKSISSFNNFFKVIATDKSVKGTQFLTAFEAYDHDIYGIMFHPEYQMLSYTSVDEWNTKKTAETMDIIENLSNFIY